ncbi:hypothetical protein CYMTET_25743 [Cymbomonas tetramitiformis]|uniref:Uncharacterized protein n=1 Tax=Cymbomonas tetramitiformis TaxID=36881 RepID=A0AAE0KYQ9_9CHLO|nr:hypothetical protein CYMTET_25743 [Cymbomonas tetramitiformis]
MLGDNLAMRRREISIRRRSPNLKRLCQVGEARRIKTTRCAATFCKKLPILKSSIPAQSVSLSAAPVKENWLRRHQPVRRDVAMQSDLPPLPHGHLNHHVLVGMPPAPRRS